LKNDDESDCGWLYQHPKSTENTPKNSKNQNPPENQSVKAYPVVCGDGHGGAHNLPRMIFSMFALQFQWLTSTLFC